MAGTLNKGSLVKGTGGSGGGGSASFPTIVTDSGSSLPVDLTGYQEGDTFLNTTDKKIYKAEESGYELNTGVTNTGSLNINDGSVTFENNQYIYREGSFFRWYGTGVKIRIHFKLTSLPEENGNYNLFSNTEGENGSPGISYWTTVRILNKKLNLYIARTQYGPSQLQNINICETDLQINTDYYLEITKNDTVADITLSSVGYGESPIETNSITTADYGNSSTPSGTKRQYYGVFGYSPNNAFFTIGQIYLGDSTGDFLTSAGLTWDSGTDLTDKTEYADKTNGALYLYENSELVKIGSSAPTVLTDQTATSMALAGNTIYKWTSALTSLSFASAEVSDLETVLYFTTGGTIQFQDSSSLKWGGDGTAPSLEANTIYCISIRNGLAEIDTFGTTA